MAYRLSPLLSSPSPIFIDNSEVFSEPVRHDVLKSLFQSFEVTVIIYIRRQDLLIESILNQILKGRQDIRSDDFWMNFDSMYVVDFKKRIEQWRLIFPTSRVRVRRYGTSSQKRPIEEDFLQVLNINPTCTATWRSEKVNPSLSLYEFTILRRLVQKGLISSRAALEEARIKLAKKIAEHQVMDGAMVGNYFSPEIRQQILEKYARSNEEIRAEFFPEDQNLFEPLSPTIRLAIDSTMVTLLESEMINDLLKEQSL